MTNFKVKYTAYNIWGDKLKSGTYRLNADTAELAKYRVEVAVKKEIPRCHKVVFSDVNESIGLLTRFALWLHE